VTPHSTIRLTGRWLVPPVLLLGAWACGGSSLPPVAGTATPVYNPQTGQLEQLVSDTNNDGVVDTRAHMEGVLVKYIEIDRDFDGKFDRTEFYRDAPGTPAAARSPDGRSVLDRAEETNGGEVVTRREFYVDGVVRRVEEDTDVDGRTDKWEEFEEGRLVTLALDLAGAGRPTRRLIYDRGGNVVRLEADDDGDGRFEEISPAGKDGGD